MSFVVIQANVQHGEGTDGLTNYSRQVNILTDGVDIACLQERSTGDTGWNPHMSAAGFSEAIYRENGHGNDGPAIWIKNSTVTVDDVYEHDLSEGAVSPWDGVPTNVDKAAVAIKCTVEEKQFYVVSTHLAWSAGADSEGSTFSAIRVAQITELLSWIDSTLTGGLTILIAGDMNFGPDYPKNPSGLQIDLFTDAGYKDCWTEAISNGLATAAWGDRNSDSTPDMPITSLTTRTHDTRRIDYFFLKNEINPLTLSNIDLPDHRVTCPHGLVSGGSLPACTPEVTQLWDTPDDFGVRPSDHNFMLATFSLTSGIVVCRWNSGCQAE